MPGTAEATKTIIESALTSGGGPQQILEQLDTLGVEWFVTQQRDLMIKTWQVGAENFMSPAEVPHLQQNPAAPVDPLNWVSGHLNELREQYPGQWIAVSGNEVRASAATLQVLLALVNAQGLQKPFVTQVPDGEILWTTAYARQDV